MKTITFILIMILLLTPAFCTACSLHLTQTATLKYVKHYTDRITYGFYDTDSDFNALFEEALNQWRENAALKICTIEDQEKEMEIEWEDTSEDPWDPTTDGLASTSVYWDMYSGNIFLVIMTFPSHFINYWWHMNNECPTPDCTYNICNSMMHEIGHALGFVLDNTQHPTSSSVMTSVENYACYTELQETDKACAQWFYPAIPESRCEHFIPVFRGDGVSIMWQTEYEYESAYFMLEKQQPDGSFAPISEPIMSVGSAHDGAEYDYFDPTGTRSDIYRLMEVDKNGIELGMAVERVLLKEPSGSSPIVLSEAERAGLRKDIDAMLEVQTSGKEKPLMAVMSGGIQWLAIYPAAFSDAIAPLITYRDYHGYNASGATYESILSQYGTIKAYLQHLWSSQSHALKYVVIVGNDDLIPAERCDDGYVGEFYAHYFTDAITADLAGDWLPELSVGRIPAASADEVSLYVAKALEYEGQEAADWNNHITYFVEDRPSIFGYQSGPVAARYAQELAELIPPTHTLHYENMLAHLPYDQCSQRSLAISEFDAGRGMVLAFGATASEYNLVEWLITKDIYEGCAFSGSQLSQNHKYAFVLGASCDIGDMNATLHPWILKELLFQRYSGAIACFAPSGNTWQRANFDISASILDYLYTHGAPTLGHSCYSAQKDEMVDEVLEYAHIARSYLYYGDPAIRLKGSVNGMAPVVTVTDPNGGEYYEGGTIHITWQVQDEDLEDIRCTVLINYSYNIGSQIWEPLAVDRGVNTVGEGSFNFMLVSGTARYDHCRIKVFATDICNNEASDISDADFTIQLVAKPSGEPIPKDPISSNLIPTLNFLSDPCPNPFNPSTTINFGLKEPGQITLTIYDVNGAVIKSLYKNEMLKAGTFTLQWDGTNDRGTSVSSGIYFLQLKTESYIEMKRLILLR